MTALYKSALLTLRGTCGKLLPRTRSERGASMIEYVLLLSLISLIAIAGVSLLGTSVSGLFSHEANCLGTQNNTNTQTGVSTLTQANQLSHGITQSNSNTPNSGSQLSTGLQINSGNPPDSTTCNATSNDSNQQNVLQLLR